MLRWWTKMLKGQSPTDEAQSSPKGYSTPYLPEFCWSEENEETDRKMVALVDETLEEQLAAYRDAYLLRIQELVGSDEIKDATSQEMAFALGRLSSVAESLSEVPQDILECVHDAFRKDGTSTLAAFFECYASSSNYDTRILERANAMAGELYAACSSQIISSYRSITENERVLLENLFYPVLSKLDQRCLSLFDERWNILVATLDHHKDKHALAVCMDAWVRTATRLYSRDLMNLFVDSFLPPYLIILEQNSSNTVWPTLKAEAIGGEFESFLRSSLKWDDLNEEHSFILGHYIMCWRELENTKAEASESVTKKTLLALAQHRQPLGDEFFNTIIENELEEIYDKMWKTRFVLPTQESIDKCS
jgi:hypothetical protein